MDMQREKPPDAACSLAAQLQCAQRELAMRQRVYPRWIREDRIAPQKAEREQALMAAIVETLARLCAQEQAHAQPSLFEEGR